MSTIRRVDADRLPAFLTSLSGQARILAPAERPGTKRAVIFAPWHDGLPITLDKATVPAKETVLPACETLFAYRQTKDSEAGKAALGLEAVPKGEPTIVFACRPCDARGYAVLDRPYLQGPFADPYYRIRRENLTVITLTCDKGCSTCFCHWVGGGPSSPEGSDVLMTGTDAGYVLQAVTPKGEALLAASDLADGADLFPKVEAVRKDAWGSLAKAPDIKAAPERLAARFTDTLFWERQTERCLSCGACTYFCPTCYCFSITDEGDAQDPKGGRRLRSWDSCMSPLFTLEASGHNPRPTKALRMRNRVSHKYSTYPGIWGSYSCSGCGRCIANCPVCLDIRAIVLAACQEPQAS